MISGCGLEKAMREKKEEKKNMWRGRMEFNEVEHSGFLSPTIISLTCLRLSNFLSRWKLLVEQSGR